MHLVGTISTRAYFKSVYTCHARLHALRMFSHYDRGVLTAMEDNRSLWIITSYRGDDWLKFSIQHCAGQNSVRLRRNSSRGPSRLANG